MILCCGEALIDMLPDELNTGQHCFVPKAGGAVFNTAVALGRLAVNVSLFTGISKDIFGEMLAKELAESQVGTDYLVCFDLPTSLAFVKFVEQQAQYTFYSAQAADTMLTPSDLPKDNSEFEGIFFGGISLCTDPTASTMLTLLRKYSKKSVIVLDPNIRPAFISDERSYRFRLNEMIELSDIVKLSDVDLTWLIPDELGLKIKLEKLFGNSGKIVVITKGKNGAVVFHSGKEIAKTNSLPTILGDTVGAGDTFNAGLIYSLIKQRVFTKRHCAQPNQLAIQNALIFATKAASYTVSKIGAVSPWLREMS